MDVSIPDMFWQRYDDGPRPEASMSRVGYLYYGDATVIGGSKYDGVKLVRSWYTMNGRNPITNEVVWRGGVYKHMDITDKKPFESVVKKLMNVNEMRETRRRLFDEEKIRHIDEDVSEIFNNLDNPLHELRKLTDTLGRA